MGPSGVRGQWKQASARCAGQTLHYVGVRPIDSLPVDGPPSSAHSGEWWRAGRLALVAAASDEESFSGGLWHAWQTAPNGDWSGWHPLDKPDPEIPALLSPALARDADRHLRAFVILQDGSVWCIRQQPAGGWSGWQSLGQPGDGPAADPALAPIANADGRLALFASVVDERGNEEIWHRRQRPTGGGWTGWSSLGMAGGGFGPHEPAAAATPTAAWSCWPRCRTASTFGAAGRPPRAMGGLGGHRRATRPLRRSSVQPLGRTLTGGWNSS